MGRTNNGFSGALAILASVMLVALIMSGFNTSRDDSTLGEIKSQNQEILRRQMATPEWSVASDMANQDWKATSYNPKTRELRVYCTVIISYKKGDAFSVGVMDDELHRAFVHLAKSGQLQRTVLHFSLLSFEEGMRRSRHPWAADFLELDAEDVLSADSVLGGGLRQRIPSSVSDELKYRLL